MVNIANKRRVFLLFPIAFCSIIFFRNYADGVSLNEDIFTEYTHETDYDIVCKRANFVTIREVLPGYKSAKKTYKSYEDNLKQEIEESGAKLKEEAYKLQEEWNETLEGLSEIKNKDEYKELYEDAKKKYGNKEAALQTKERDLYAKQQDFQILCQTKYDELLSPYDRQCRKVVDDFSSKLSEVISNERKKKGEKAVKVVIENSEIFINSEKYLKEIENFDVTSDIVKIIKTNVENKNQNLDDNQEESTTEVNSKLKNKNKNKDKKKLM